MRYLILILLFLYRPVFAAPHEGDSPSAASEDEDAGDLLACTTLSYVLKGNELPKTQKEWKELLTQFGEVKEAGIVFSQAPHASHLKEPRHLMALSTTKLQPGVLQPDLSSRLFIGANLKWNSEKRNFDSTKVEFQTWSWKLKHPVFGIIENPGTEQQMVTTVPINDCSKCHVAGTQVFQTFPWSNAASVGAVKQAFEHQLNEFLGDKSGVLRSFDNKLGFDVIGNADKFDEETKKATLIRQQHRLPRIVKPEDRAEVTSLLIARELLGKGTSVGPRRDAQESEAQKNTEKLNSLAAAPTMDDSAFEASQLNNRERREFFSQEGVRRLSAEIESGAYKPPSDLDAAKRTNYVNKPALKDIIKASAGAAFGSGLPDPSGEALTKMNEANLKSQKKPLNAANWGQGFREMVDEILKEPEWKPFLDAGILPERHERIPLVYSSLEKFAKRHNLAWKPPHSLAPDPRLEECLSKHEKKQWAVKPVSQHATEDNHRCARCHLGPNARNGKLPFDPFDVEGREAWIKQNDAAVVKRWLESIQHRVYEVADMPPSDAKKESEGLSLTSPELLSLKRFIEETLTKPR